MKTVTSTNPVKSYAVYALKKVSGCSRVTSVREDDSFYYGICHKYDYPTRKYISAGEFKVRKEEISKQCSLITDKEAARTEIARLNDLISKEEDWNNICVYRGKIAQLQIYI